MFINFYYISLKESIIIKHRKFHFFKKRFISLKERSLSAYFKFNSTFLLKILFAEQYDDIKNILNYKLNRNEICVFPNSSSFLSCLLNENNGGIVLMNVLYTVFVIFIYQKKHSE